MAQLGSGARGRAHDRPLRLAVPLDPSGPSERIGPCRKGRKSAFCSGGPDHTPPITFRIVVVPFAVPTACTGER